MSGHEQLAGAFLSLHSAHAARLLDRHRFEQTRGVGRMQAQERARELLVAAHPGLRSFTNGSWLKFCAGTETSP